MGLQVASFYVFLAKLKFQTWLFTLKSLSNNYGLRYYKENWVIPLITLLSNSSIATISIQTGIIPPVYIIINHFEKKVKLWQQKNSFFIKEFSSKVILLF